MSEVRRVAVVGTGVIGRAWVACFLGQGLDVVAYDPMDPEGKKLRSFVEEAWATIERLGAAPGAAVNRVSFASDIQAAVGDADFVQENGPERRDAKRDLMVAIDAAAPVPAVVASSSSGLTPTELQDGCRHPERILIGHPFNPAHVIPLVEVVGGRATSELAIASTMHFYSRIGKHPIRVHAELPGHVTNRLQAALWQEAYSLIDRGVVSVADLDAAIAYGPGLRWALAGPMLNQHLSGGDAGLRHVLEHLGPACQEWMADLRQAPLTPWLIDTLVDGVQDELDGRSDQDVVAARDAALIALLEMKQLLSALP